MTALIALAAILGQDAPPRLAKQDLADIEGKSVSLPAKDAKATVLLFVAVDCPISNRYAPEMQRLYKDFHEKSVTFVRVYVDDSVSTDDIRKHGVEFKMPSAAVLDGKHALVKQLGMTVTPEVAVVTPDGKLQYRGRINDLYIEHGRLREGDVRQDLRVAIEEVLAGKTVSKPFTNAIGCGIPDGD
ncbi:MAG: redoxin domain-containing protein [Armatimonadetes bacterium]|nr:redoxin domain-containing protein [Armatimonadota bacterium]